MMNAIKNNEYPRITDLSTDTNAAPEQSQPTFVYANPLGYEVHCTKFCDMITKREKFGFTIINKAKKHESETVYLTHSKMKDCRAFNFLFDYSGDFDFDDVTNVKKIALAKRNRFPVVGYIEKVGLDDLHKELTEYVEGNQLDGLVVVKDGYYHIEAKKFKEVIIEGDYGYTALEVKKQFKLKGWLRINNGRPYDFSLTDKEGGTYRTISFIPKKIDGGQKNAD